MLSFNFDILNKKLKFSQNWQNENESCPYLKPYLSLMEYRKKSFKTNQIFLTSHQVNISKINTGINAPK
jgi:hypothetical protein